MFVDDSVADSINYVAYVVAPAGKIVADPSRALNVLGVCDEVRANTEQPVGRIWAAQHYFLEFNKGPTFVIKKDDGLRFDSDAKIRVTKAPENRSLGLSRFAAGACVLSK